MGRRNEFGGGFCLFSTFLRMKRSMRCLLFKKKKKKKKSKRLKKKIYPVVITAEVLKDHPYPYLFALCYKFLEFSTLNFSI